MNFLDCVQDVAFRLDNQSINNQIKVWVNLAQQEIARADNWHFLGATSSLTTTSGISEYALSGNCDKVLAMWQATTPAKLAYLDAVDFVKMFPDPSDTGEPRCYTLFKEGYTQLYPIPNGTYTVFYKYKKMLPDLSSDSDTSLIPKKWHELLIHGALARAYQYNDDTRYQDSYTIFKNGVQEMRKEEFNQFDNEPSIKPHTVQVSTNYERIFS